jgi:regulator of protease activity HflC (stomatin/prohibitin superfamily)
MVKNSIEGNRARTARYRAGLAARGIRPVQLFAPSSAHALLRRATGLMTREQDPLEPRQALRQASGANDPGEVASPADARVQALAVEVEAVKVELAVAREAERQAGQRALAQAEVARTREAAATVRADSAERERAAAEAAAAQARAEAERFREAPGLRGRVIRWLAR